MANIEDTLIDRNKRYGSLKGHAEITQGLKDVMRSFIPENSVVTKWEKLSNDKKEALEMIAHKIGRILNGDPEYHDSWHDIVGYAKLVSDTLEPIKVEDDVKEVAGSHPMLKPTFGETQESFNKNVADDIHCWTPWDGGKHSPYHPEKVSVFVLFRNGIASRMPSDSADWMHTEHSHDIVAYDESSAITMNYIMINDTPSDAAVKAAKILEKQFEIPESLKKKYGSPSSPIADAAELKKKSKPSKESVMMPPEVSITEEDSEKAIPLAPEDMAPEDALAVEKIFSIPEPDPEVEDIVLVMNPTAPEKGAIFYGTHNEIFAGRDRLFRNTQHVRILGEIRKRDIDPDLDISEFKDPYMEDIRCLEDSHPPENEIKKKFSADVDSSMQPADLATSDIAEDKKKDLDCSLQPESIGTESTNLDTIPVLEKSAGESLAELHDGLELKQKRKWTRKTDASGNPLPRKGKKGMNAIVVPENEESLPGAKENPLYSKKIAAPVIEPKKIKPEWSEEGDKDLIRLTKANWTPLRMSVYFNKTIQSICERGYFLAQKGMIEPKKYHLRGNS